MFLLEILEEIWEELLDDVGGVIDFTILDLTSGLICFHEERDWLPTFWYMDYGSSKNVLLLLLYELLKFVAYPWR